MIYLQNPWLITNKRYEVLIARGLSESFETFMLNSNLSSYFPKSPIFLVFGISSGCQSSTRIKHLCTNRRKYARVRCAHHTCGTKEFIASGHIAAEECDTEWMPEFAMGLTNEYRTLSWKYPTVGTHHRCGVVHRQCYGMTNQQHIPMMVYDWNDEENQNIHII